jgi:hypothetical protein
MECCKRDPSLKVTVPPPEETNRGQSAKQRKQKNGTEKQDDRRTFANCTQCKRIVEVSPETGRFVQHRYLKDGGWHCPKSGTVPPVPGPEQKSGKRRCPVCSKWLTPMLDGRRRSHKQSTGTRCPGSGSPHAEGVQKRRGRSRGGSVYASPGGLPGLGKRR